MRAVIIRPVVQGMVTGFRVYRAYMDVYARIKSIQRSSRGAALSSEQILKTLGFRWFSVQRKFGF